MMASIGTPAGSSQAGSITGHCAAGAVKRELACAAGSFEAGVQKRRNQLDALAGGSFVYARTSVNGTQTTTTINTRDANTYHAFPPHVVVRSQRHIGEQRVAFHGTHRVRVGVVGRAWCNAKEAVLWVDGAQFTVWSESHPSNIITDPILLLLLLLS